MNSSNLTTVVRNINKTFFWEDYIKRNPKDKKLIERGEKFTFLEGEELIQNIEKIKKFDINKVWDKSYMGLKQHDSICAVSSELSNNIKRIKNLAIQQK